MTPEQLSALESHAAGWAANALSTEPVVAERLVPAVHALYAAAGLNPPRVVIVSSPIVMAFAGGFAAAIWWVRRNNGWAWGDGLTWATGYFRREGAGESMSELGRPTLEDATRLATELATQPTSEQARITDRRGSLRRTSRENRLSGALGSMEQPSWALTERTTRGTCTSATNQGHGDRTLAVMRQLTEQPVGQVTQQVTQLAITPALQHATRWAMDLAERYERIKTGKKLLFTDRASAPATLGVEDGVDDRLMREREAAHHAFFSQSAPYYLSTGRFASLAYDLGAEFGIDYLLLLHCAHAVEKLYQGGNMESPVECYLSACRDVLGLTLPAHKKYGAWESCAIEGGVRIVHDEFCIVSDRPAMLKVDDQNRPHCADGPSHRWRDGWRLYHWHGTHIPPEYRYLILAPWQISAAGIEKERNAEMRRVMIERYGAVRYFIDSEAAVVDELPADHRIIGLRSARLRRKDPQGGRGEPVVFVDLLNSTPEPDGTVKRYLLRVDPKAYGGDASRHVHAAVASTWRNADGSLTFRHWMDYEPDAES